MKRNPNLRRLTPNYLFPEIAQRKERFLSANPHASLISLGVGDTTEPIPESITRSLVGISSRLGTREGYSGYGPEQGMDQLRSSIASEIYSNRIRKDEVFVSDGAKSDISRLQILFGTDVSIALQDPTYPVYLEGSIIQGVRNITLMSCTPENQFFPDLNTLPPTDLIYFCSPNNPTAAAATRDQLCQLVAFAKKNRSIILYDSAYANYIQDPTLPRSIYEIEGAKDVSIEVGSFSKLAGFTGVRLGWTIVPDDVRYEDGSSVRSDWNRLTSTLFNGASNIAQHGGHAALKNKGKEEVAYLSQYYLENTRILKETMVNLDYEVFGGVHAPYLWVRMKGKKSWDIFQDFLKDFHLVVTPGSGFGVSGEGFIRMSAFAQREAILDASKRLRSNRS